ncbi:MAG: hypothetical protein Q9215_000480 [Flavoplaca cf. flavocitrina]
MAGRCRVLIRAIAGTLGLVAAPVAIHHVDPTIIDSVKHYLAERFALTAKNKLPELMPEIPFMPSATVKVDQMLDSHWAYYLGLLMLLVSFIPTIAQIAKLLWNASYYNDCKVFIIVGRTGEIDLINENDILPSAFKSTAPPRRHRIRMELESLFNGDQIQRTLTCSQEEAVMPRTINGALTVQTTPVSINSSLFGGLKINLSKLLHGSQAERLVLAVLLQFVFAILLKDHAFYQQLLRIAWKDLHIYNGAIKHLFMALRVATDVSSARRPHNDSESIELLTNRQELENHREMSTRLQNELAAQTLLVEHKDKQITDFRVTQQQSDAKIATLMEIQQELQTEIHTNEKVKKVLRAKLAELEGNAAGPPTTNNGDGQPPVPATRAPRFTMGDFRGDIIKQKLSDMEKENAKLGAKSSACTCSAGPSAGSGELSTRKLESNEPSTQSDGSKTPFTAAEASGNTPTPALAPNGGLRTGEEPDPIAPGEADPGRDEVVRIPSINKSLKAPYSESCANRTVSQGNIQVEPSKEGEDEPSQATEPTPKGGRKKRRRRIRRRPNGANNDAPTGPKAGHEDQGGEEADVA